MHARPDLRMKSHLQAAEPRISDQTERSVVPAEHRCAFHALIAWHGRNRLAIRATTTP